MEGGSRPQGSRAAVLVEGGVQIWGSNSRGQTSHTAHQVRLPEMPRQKRYSNETGEEGGPSKGRSFKGGAY